MHRVVIRVTDEFLAGMSALVGVEDPAEAFGDRRFALITFTDEAFEMTIKFMPEEEAFELVKQDSNVQVLM